MLQSHVDQYGKIKEGLHCPKTLASPSCAEELPKWVIFQLWDIYEDRILADITNHNLSGLFQPYECDPSSLYPPEVKIIIDVRKLTSCQYVSPCLRKSWNLMVI